MSIHRPRGVDYRVYVIGQIYDGYDNEAPILLETCNLDKGEPVTTMSNVAFIELYTEVLRLGSWFDLTWLQVPKSEADWNVDVKRRS